MSTAAVWLDGVEITSASIEGTLTRRLNRPSVAQIKVPMDAAAGGPGSYVKIYFDGTLVHHGRVMLCETTAETDTGYTVYNTADPLELWNWRPVRDPGTVTGHEAGDFSNPNIITDFVSGPQIIEAMMNGSEGTDGAGGGTGVPPNDAEGLLRLARGTFEVGGVDLSGAPTDWPMTMAELASLLISTGEVDVVITPIEFDGDFNYGQIDVYNGLYGSDLSATVKFQYGMGAFNVRSLRWNQDMTNMSNKIWYYLGPRLDEQHWRANITGYNPSNPNWAACSMDPTDVITRDNDSQGGPPDDDPAHYDVRMDIKVYDSRGDEAIIGYCLYRRLWAIESWFRAVPLELVHITPARDTHIGDFDIGDQVLVEATPAVRGGFSGVQRVYEYTVSWGNDSVLEIGELQTSATGDDFSV